MRTLARMVLPTRTIVKASRRLAEARYDERNGSEAQELAKDMCRMRNLGYSRLVGVIRETCTYGT